VITREWLANNTDMYLRTVTVSADVVYALLDEIDNYKKAAPFCDKHKPNGGSRGECLVCVLIEYSHCISRIDYAIGPPNEMQCSGYDVFGDPSLVVRRVESLMTIIKALGRELGMVYKEST